LSKFGIKKSSTTAFHPSSNGLCERFNKTIQGKLLSFLAENNAQRHQWLNFLPSALFSYRSSVHSTTGFRPSDLLFSFKAKDFLPRGKKECDTIVHEQASRNISRNRVEASARIRQTSRHFLPGSHVLVKAPHKGKLQLQGQEACVIRQLSPQVVKVELSNGRQINVSTFRVSPLSSDPNLLFPFEVSEVPVSPHVRRSTRIRKMPDRYSPD
jgi:hypothetical protein